MAEMNFRIKIKDPSPIREKVYNVLRESIYSGEFAQGERIVQNRLAEQINTSRTPVREALHMLEREGLLEAIPRVGYKVKPIVWEEVEEVCAIRLINETLAAEWAMERISVKEMNKLEKNISLSEKKAKKKDMKEFIKLDSDFHDIIVNASGSKRISDFCQTLHRLMLRYRYGGIIDQKTALGAIDGHRRILESLKEKNKTKLLESIRSHLEYAKETIKLNALESR